MNVPIPEDKKVHLLNTEDVYAIMQKVLLRENKIDRDREHFWILGLANNNRLLFIELISLESVNKTIVEPMEVFSFALQKRAVKIILVHNHPSGGLIPSPADEDITDRLIQVGLIVDTPVLDHLIITEERYISFEEKGIMKRLASSIKYVPPYQLKERIKAEAARISEEMVERERIKAAKERDLEIARGLKEKGISLEVIMETTGLLKEEVESL